MRLQDAAGTLGWGHIFPAEAPVAGLARPRLVPGVTVLIAEENDEIVGFAVSRASGDQDAGPETGELDGLYTDPSVGGRASASRCSTKLSASCGGRFEDATLWTAEENDPPSPDLRARWASIAVRTRRIYDVDFVELRYRRPLDQSTARSASTTRS